MEATSINLKDWIGRTETVADTITPTPYAALSATLDRPRRAAAERARRCRRCGTGSTSCRCTASRRSGPTATPSAAASCRRCRCRAACGRAASSSSTRRCASATRVTRTSTIADVNEKSGRTGPLVFVKVRHEIRRERGSRRRAHRVPRHRLPRSRPSASDVAPPPQAAPAAIRHGSAVGARRRAAVPLLGADLQRPPHPLRPPLRHRGRGLSRPDRARPADRHAAARPAAPPAARGAASRASSSRPCARRSTSTRSSSAASPRPTARPSICGPRTTKAG